MLGLNGILIASGYALYYAGGEGVRSIASPLHWIAGLGLPPLLVWHWWEGRSTRVTKAHPRRRPGRPSGPLPPGASPPPGHALH
jgi:hypothetical protein